MKQFCRIFVLYFIALVMMPCTDVHATAEATLTSEYSSDHDNCPHENETDFCSPFCVCSCCGQVIVVVVPERNQVPQSATIAVITKLIPAEAPSFQSEFLDRLFHPPRV